jgi:small-conductance mechanosensitive channel
MPIVASIFPVLAAHGINWDLDLELVLRGAVKAVVTLVLAYLARWALRRLAKRIIARVEAGDPATVSSRVQRATTVAQIVTHAGMAVIAIVAGLFLLDIVINIAPLVAGAGVLGLALSLGGAGVMKDMIAGFLILVEDQYAVGERIGIGDLQGAVHQLSLRLTVLRTDDGTLHYIANGSISAVANLSRGRAGRTVAP